jgi:hypothetical protein
MQLAVHFIDRRVEQNQLDLQECLKYHHSSGSDDEDDADGILPMPEDVSIVPEEFLFLDWECIFKPVK